MKSQNLSSKVFSLLRGQSPEVKSFDVAGNQVPDPSQAVRFFVDDPNLMVTIDSDENHIIINTGSGDSGSLQKISNLIRRLAHKNLMNCDVRKFGQFIQPKQFSPTASGTDQLMEFTGSAMEKPVNSYILGKVFNELDYRQGVSADQLTRDIPGSDLNDIQRALNRLVADHKAAIDPTSGGRLYLKKMEESSLLEAFSRMYGGSKTSRQSLGPVRLTVKHRSPVDETARGARARDISAIFLEANGERFRFPHNSLLGARAMARHLSEGGEFGDGLGTRIVEMTGELAQLREFSRYVQRNNLISESTSDSVELIAEGIDRLTGDLRGLSGRRTYESVKSRLSDQTLSEGTTDQLDKLREMFTIRQFDARFESVLPVIQRLGDQRGQHRRQLEELASAPVVVSQKPGGVAQVLEFSSDQGGLAWRLGDFGRRIQGAEPLAEFIQSVSNRVARGQKLTEFEAEITRRALANSTAETTRHESSELRENRQLADFFDRLLYRSL